MQIAVACVKDVRDPELVSRRNVVSSIENLRQTRTRHHCILDHRIRLDATNRAERALARGPELLSFRFITRVTTTARAVFQANASHFLGLIVEPCFRSEEPTSELHSH